MGAERKSMVLSKAEIKNTAYHEAGHTLVAELVEHADPVHRSLLSHGDVHLVTQMLPEEDRLNVTKRYAIDQIAVLFGGRIAEDIMFDEITTGAGNDLDRATDMARKMVCEWAHEFTRRDDLWPKRGKYFPRPRYQPLAEVLSEETAVSIDNEVKDIMDAQYKRATQLIEDNKDALIRIAEALIEYETLDAKIDKLMRGEELTREPPKVRMQTREDLEEKRRQKEERDNNGPKDLQDPLADAGA